MKDQHLKDYILYLRSITLDQPHLGNQFLEDSALQEYLNIFLPKEIQQKINDLMVDLGQKCTNELHLLSQNCEKYPPTLEQFNAFGERIDKIHTAEGWRQQHVLAAKLGIVSLSYDETQNDLQPYQRFIQLVRLYIYAPSSGLYGCPLAMTDGAASVLRGLIKENRLHQKTLNVIKNGYQHLTTSDPNQFWTSGQWMTEKLGGSDVSNSTQTIAIKYKSKSSDLIKYKLYGYKWFSSATDCNMSLVLARIVEDVSILKDSTSIQKIPLSLFFVKLRKKNQQLNNIEVVTLKNKLGTRQLPTAELILNGTKSHLISEPNRGVKEISKMLNITRIYNSATAVGNMRRMMALVRDYANRRKVKNKLLNEIDLQKQVILDLEVSYRTNLLFYLKISQLQSFYEAGQSDVEQNLLLRMMTPVLKLFSAKENLKMASEGLEFFGGLGYLENSNLPVILRDSQVLSIWEGTTNVLSEDMLRAILPNKNEKTSKVLESFAKFCINILDKSTIRNKIFDDKRSRDAQSKLINQYNDLFTDLQKLISGYQNKLEYNLRKISFGVAKIFIAFLLMDAFMELEKNSDKELFLYYIFNNILYQRINPMENEPRNQLILDLDKDGNKNGVGDFDRQGQPRPKF